MTEDEKQLKIERKKLAIAREKVAEKKRIDDLYQAVAGFLDKKYSWFALRRWGNRNGYSWKEIQHAKRAVEQRLKEQGAL